jgi:hypothetical protein
MIKNAEMQLEKWIQRRLENLENYARYKKRLETMIDKNSIYEIKDMLEEIEQEIDRADLMIKIYKKDLEARA